MQSQDACFHAGLLLPTYGEQREARNAKHYELLLMHDAITASGVKSGTIVSRVFYAKKSIHILCQARI